jgi:hypothetical protein
MKDKCCGNCKHFKDEDAEGWGTCKFSRFTKCDAKCIYHSFINNGWTEITPDNVEELYNIPEDLLIVAFKLGDTIYYQRNKDMRPTLNTLAKTGGYYYYVLPELKIYNEQAD